MEPYINAFIYTECLIKIIAVGFVLGENSYLRDGWNVLDFVVVLASVLYYYQKYLSSTDHMATKGMQAFRSFRLLRPLRLIGRIESLKTMISTLLSSLQALGATLGLIIFCFVVYAIFGMNVWSGALHWRCYETEKPIDGEW